MRDFEIYGNDLIVGTHGRGFWVIDDISPLRQITDAVARADAFLFKPADAIDVMQGGDNGTPTQKDEPTAPNPPAGAAIDYYLKTAATGPVTLEIQDSSGTCLAVFSSDAATARACAGAAAARRPRIRPWRRRRDSEHVRACGARRRRPSRPSAGMHRVNWAPAGAAARVAGVADAAGGAAKPVGPFTAKLTVNGRTYTQTFDVKPDPRVR